MIVLNHNNIFRTTYSTQEMSLTVINDSLHVRLNDVLSYFGLSFKGNKSLEETIQVFKGFSTPAKTPLWGSALFFPVELLKEMILTISSANLTLSDIQMRRLEVAAEILPRYLGEYILAMHETSNIEYDETDGSISSISIERRAA